MPNPVEDAIRILLDERARIDQAISVLRFSISENGTPLGKRRGRKFMSPAERAQVAVRMKKYWAKRRKEQQKAEASV